MAKEFNAVAGRGKELGLNDDEVAFYDALETNEASVRDLGDDTLKQIAIELTDNLRKNTTIDWAVRETVRARLRLMVKRILRKYKYPPDQEIGFDYHSPSSILSDLVFIFFTWLLGIKIDRLSSCLNKPFILSIKFTGFIVYSSSPVETSSKCSS